MRKRIYYVAWAEKCGDLIDFLASQHIPFEMREDGDVVFVAASMNIIDRLLYLLLLKETKKDRNWDRLRVF